MSSNLSKKTTTKVNCLVNMKTWATMPSSRTKTPIKTKSIKASTTMEREYCITTRAALYCLMITWDHLPTGMWSLKRSRLLWAKTLSWLSSGSWGLGPTRSPRWTSRERVVTPSGSTVRSAQLPVLLPREEEAQLKTQFTSSKDRKGHLKMQTCLPV